MKIVSDFDGVWTEPAGEAAWIYATVVSELAALSGASEREMDVLTGLVRERIRSAPRRYGWAPDGRIAAYVDEDRFCEGDAIVGCLAVHADEEPFASFLSAVLGAGFPSPSEFANHCFRVGAASYRASHEPALVPRARESFERMADSGFEVVIVSNASAVKVVDWFRGCGVDAGVGQGHVLRVRGEAGKQQIGGSSRRVLCGRQFYDDRPAYRAALLEERPDLIIGDVFSLDLLQGHALRCEGHPSAPKWLVLRRQAHTPAWVWRTRVDGAIDAMVDHVESLVDCVGRLSGRRSAQRAIASSRQ